MTEATDALLAELRAGTPAAPGRLRERIEAIATREPATPRPFLDRISLRRALVVTAPAALAVMLGVAITHGVATTGDGQTSATAKPSAELQADSGTRGSARVPARPVPYGIHKNAQVPKAQAGQPLQSALGAVQGGAGASGATPPAAKTRAQDYEATLTVRVHGLDRLSDATKAAIQATRGWGGYVVSADYAVPGRNGDSTLVLKIPVQHVQAAIQRFSSLGTLAAQNVSIRDLQGTLDAYTRQLLNLRETMAKIRVQLARPDLSAPERARLELKLAQLTKRATTVRAEQRALARSASFATVSLTLTTRSAAAAAPHKQGRIERTLRDAASILGLELAYGLYGLIVIAPLALLAALAFLGARIGRRRADDRLLSRA